jgi:hypothetical protein
MGILWGESSGTSDADRQSDLQRRASRPGVLTQERFAAITVELQDALAREAALLRGKMIFCSGRIS